MQRRRNISLKLLKDQIFLTELSNIVKTTVSELGDINCRRERRKFKDSIENPILSRDWTVDLTGPQELFQTSKVRKIKQ